MKERDKMLAISARIEDRMKFVHQLKSIVASGLAMPHELSQLKEMIKIADIGICKRMEKLSQIVSDMDGYDNKDCIEVTYLSAVDRRAGKVDISIVLDGSVTLDIDHFKILRVTSSSK